MMIRLFFLFYFPGLSSKPHPLRCGGELVVRYSNRLQLRILMATAFPHLEIEAYYDRRLNGSSVVARCHIVSSDDSEKSRHRCQMLDMLVRCRLDSSSSSKMVKVLHLPCYMGSGCRTGSASSYNCLASPASWLPVLSCWQFLSCDRRGIKICQDRKTRVGLRLAPHTRHPSDQ